MFALIVEFEGEIKAAREEQLKNKPLGFFSGRF